MDHLGQQNAIPVETHFIYKVATERNFAVKKVTDIIIFIFTLKWINDQYQLEQDNRLILYFSLVLLELHLHKVAFKKIVLFLKREHRPKICGYIGQFHLFPIAGIVSCIMKFAAAWGLLTGETKNMLLGIVLKTVLDVVFLVVLMILLIEECRCDTCLGIPETVNTNSWIRTQNRQNLLPRRQAAPQVASTPVQAAPRVPQPPIRGVIPAQTIEINVQFNVQVDVPNHNQRSVQRQTEEEALEQNQNVLDNIDNVQLKSMLMETLRCKICDIGVNLYCCKQCSNGFCRECHENMKQRNISKRCPYCATEQDSYKFVVLPRMS